MRTLWITTLRKWRRWISYCMWNWKTLLELLNKWFPEWLWTNWVLCLQMISISFWIFTRTIVLYWRGEQPIIRTRWVKDLPEVRSPTQKVFSGPIVNWFLYFFDIHEVLTIALHKELLEDVISDIGILLLHHLRPLLLQWHILFIHIQYYILCTNPTPP